MKQLGNFNNGVYLFPFTAEAALLYHVCQNNNIQVKGFFDNDRSLDGKEYAGCRISIPCVVAEPTIICGHRHYDHFPIKGGTVKIEQVLEKTDVSSAIDLIDSRQFDILAVRQQLRLRRLDYELKQILLPREILRDDNAMILNSVFTMVTSRCSLRCKDCSDMMQYYKHPKDAPLHQVTSDLDKVFSIADFARNLLIVGGEPLIYPQLVELLQHISKYREKIGSIWIVTNGTILPSEELLGEIRRNDVLFRISNYREKSSKLKEIVELCESTGTRVEVITLENYQWREEKRLVVPPCEDGVENNQRFIECQGRILCNSINKGKYYLCEFLARAEDLKCIPYDKENSLELNTATKESMKKFFSERKTPPGCAYCTGDNIQNMPYIEPAIQMKGTIDFKSFAETYETVY